MLELADCEGLGPQHRQEIAKRQAIPLDFMDHITSKLRCGRLIASVRGRSGGLILARAPESISLWQIFSVVEDHLSPVKCLHEGGCELEELCSSYEAWDEVYSLVQRELGSKTLAEITDRWRQKKKRLKKSIPAPAPGCERY